MALPVLCYMIGSFATLTILLVHLDQGRHVVGLERDEMGGWILASRDDIEMV